MYRHEQTNSLYKRINLLVDTDVYNLHLFSDLYQASCIQRPRMLKAPVLRLAERGMFNDKDKKSSGVCFGSDADSSHFRSSGDGRFSDLSKLSQKCAPS